MDLRRLATLALLVSVLPAPGARADHPVEGPRGLPCRFLWTGNPSTGEVSGRLGGGPYVGSGTLTCTARFGPSTATRSASGSGVAYLPPTPVVLATPVWAPLIEVCTSFTPAGGPTLYWHETAVHAVGHWSATPWNGSNACGRGVNVDVPSMQDIGDLFTCCFEDWYDWYVCPFFYQVYGIAEPVVTVDPGDGDVSVAGTPIWDCPPYGDVG